MSSSLFILLVVTSQSADMEKLGSAQSELHIHPLFLEGPSLPCQALFRPRALGNSSLSPWGAGRGQRLLCEAWSLGCPVTSYDVTWWPWEKLPRAEEPDCPGLQSAQRAGCHLGLLETQALLGGFYCGISMGDRQQGPLSSAEGGWVGTRTLSPKAHIWVLVVESRGLDWAGPMLSTPGLRGLHSKALGAGSADPDPAGLCCIGIFSH
jgi:hypothetical protein